MFWIARFSKCLAAVAFLGLLLPAISHAQLRTTPDIRHPNGGSGTGINRDGIRTSNGRRPPVTNRIIVPGGGASYYGYFPGRSYYYNDGYYSGNYYHDGYYNDNYYCPYCGSRWCRGQCRYRGNYYLPPVVGDAGTIYGPRAARRFLGVGSGANPRTNSGGGPLRVAADAAPDAPPKLSNPSTRALAWKFVEYGDRQFKKGDYRDALDRYRKAEQQADEIAEIYFRQGFALTGMEKYPEAVAAFREGLRRKPNWPDSGFVLEELYPEADAKRAVFRQLHERLADFPNDADAMFLMATMQHFDGQTAAAEVRFRRVVELTGLGDHARAFLPQAPEAEVAEKFEDVEKP